MPILKDEPIFDPEKDYPGGDCYMKPRHIIIEGTQEEMGYELAKLAQRDYGVKVLPKYTNGTYGEAHRTYLERNFPNLVRMSKGVLKAFGLDEDDAEHDATQIPYDFTPLPVGSNAKGIALFNFCSFVNLPREKSVDGSVFTSRNYDLFAMNLWKGFLDLPKEEGEYDCWSRSLVMEKRPTDGGYRTLLVGGMEMLNPYVDGMNEKGLYFTLLSDPYGKLRGNLLINRKSFSSLVARSGTERSSPLFSFLMCVYCILYSCLMIPLFFKLITTRCTTQHNTQHSRRKGGFPSVRRRDERNRLSDSRSAAAGKMRHGEGGEEGDSVESGPLQVFDRSHGVG